MRVVETGSFSKAAREFNTTQPTVTKQVAATEARLKVRLLNRNTRGVSLTESGALYYEKCKSIVRERRRPRASCGCAQSQAQGLLRIGTSVAFGRRVVVPLALEYMARHPQVQVDLSFEDRYVDLVAQGIDVAVRMGKLADSSLGARFLGMNPWVMVAAPGYLKKHGTPKRAQDLSAHVALIYSSVVGDDVWQHAHAQGRADHGAGVGAAALEQRLGRACGRARGAGHRADAALRGERFAGRRQGGGGAGRPCACPSRRSMRSFLLPSWCRARCRASWPFCRGASARGGGRVSEPAVTALGCWNAQILTNCRNASRRRSGLRIIREVWERRKSWKPRADTG